MPPEWRPRRPVSQFRVNGRCPPRRRDGPRSTGRDHRLRLLPRQVRPRLRRRRRVTDRARIQRRPHHHLTTRRPSHHAGHHLAGQRIQCTPVHQRSDSQLTSWDLHGLPRDVTLGTEVPPDDGDSTTAGNVSRRDPTTRYLTAPRLGQPAEVETTCPPMTSRLLRRKLRSIVRTKSVPSSRASQPVRTTPQLPDLGGDAIADRACVRTTDAARRPGEPAVVPSG